MSVLWNHILITKPKLLLSVLLYCSTYWSTEQLTCLNWIQNEKPSLGYLIFIPSFSYVYNIFKEIHLASLLYKMTNIYVFRFKYGTVRNSPLTARRRREQTCARMLRPKKIFIRHYPTHPSSICWVIRLVSLANGRTLPSSMKDRKNFYWRRQYLFAWLASVITYSGHFRWVTNPSTCRQVGVVVALFSFSIFLSAREIPPVIYIAPPFL